MRVFDSMFPLALRAAAVVATATLAQTQSVIPAVAQSQAPSINSSRVPLYGAAPRSRNEARTQLVYATRELSGPFTIRSLQFRADPAVDNPALTARLKIEVSTTPKTFLEVIPWFEQNHGADRQVVFDGEIELPATKAGAWPTPWQVPIVLQTPFAFDPTSGASLVIDFTIRGNSSQQPWRIEEYSPDGGSVRQDHFSSGCRNSRGNFSSGTSTSPAIPGRPFSLAFGGYPNNKPVVATGAILYGPRGVGGNFGGYTLPVLLTTIGMPSRSECYLAVEPVLATPTTYNSGRTIPSSSLVIGSPPPVIPDVPAFYGARLYAQALSLDPDDKTGEMFLFPSQSIEITVGNGIKVEGSVVSSKGDASSPSGSLSQDQAVVLRLNG